MPRKKAEEEAGLNSWQARKTSGAYYPSEENQQVTAYLIALRQCPEVDWDNPDDIENAINRYIAIAHEYGFKPALTSFSVCTHTPRQTIQTIREGRSHRNLRTMKMLRELSTLCESATREGLTMAKNPSGYIFELKALYGWSDAPVYQVEQREDITENTTMKALADKYMESIVVDDRQLVKVKEPPIEEVESTAVIVEDSDDQRRNY